MAVLILVLAWAVSAVRALRAARRGGCGDRAAGLLALAVRGLPADRAAWGVAMLVELEQARGTRARWGFCLGCARAATTLRVRAAVCARDRGAKATRAGLLSAVVGAVALSVFGLVRYPDLRAGTPALETVAGLVVILVAYALCVLTLLRGTTVQAVAGRRGGVLAGLVVGAAWLVVLAPTGLHEWVIIPLAITLICPWTVAVFISRVDSNAKGGPAANAKGGPAAALWSGVVGGLVVFVIWVAATYLNDGRPYDPQLIRDFHRSGAHDLASYAVGGSLDSAVGLLVVIPVVCFALGSLGGLMTAHHDRPTQRARAGSP